ncbi:MAG: hypothetical protein GY711_33210 [bacterium]|nr:hypothetical protein [bacterium]
MDWVSGTGLRPVLSGLSDAERERFLEAYRAVLAAEYPRGARGLSVFRFPRLFLVATAAD